MDGDVSMLLYPPTLEIVESIFPQILNIIYTSINTYGICQNDCKVSNFLWKNTDKKVKIYVGDFGIAKKCKFNNVSDFKKYLVSCLNVFISSFVKLYEFGSSNKDIHKLDINNNKKHILWFDTFMLSLHKAIKNDPKWTELFPDGIKSFVYGYLFKSLS